MLIGQIYSETFYFYSSSLSSVHLVNDVQKLDWPLNSEPYHGTVYCCCDGLFLIGIWSKPKEESSILLLWNPSIRKSIVLSYSELPPHESFLYGLGYDSFREAYKVVRIDEDLDDDDDEILVLEKNGSWRKIDEIRGGITNGFFYLSNMDCLAFLHGAFHWIGVLPRFCVASFNISSEMYREIPLPPEMGWRANVGVSILGGMLCAYFNDHKMFNLWIMKKYDTKESWKKLFTIPSNGIASITPIYMFSDDQVLLSCGGMLYRISHGAFELCKNLIWPLNYDDIFTHIQDNIIYTESLISPKFL